MVDSGKRVIVALSVLVGPMTWCVDIPGVGPVRSAAVLAVMQNDGDQNEPAMPDPDKATPEDCLRCHADMVSSDTAHAHPVGKMPIDIPQALLDAGAKAGADRQTMTCLTCHLPHGEKDKRLDVNVGTADQLCLSCHARISPALFNPSSPFKHSQDCSACHSMHGSEAEKYLFADASNKTELCINCHDEKESIVDQAHDFQDRLARKNAFGMAPTESGTCGFCHAIHGADAAPLLAVTKQPVSGANGACMPCHSPEQHWTAKPGPLFRHPTKPSARAYKDSEVVLSEYLPLFGDDGRRKEDGLIACATCHNVHADASTAHALLRVEEDEAPKTLCVACHTSRGTLQGSLHHERFIGKLDHADSICGPCHMVHPPPGTDATKGMWMAPTAQAAYPPETRRCTGCHPMKTGGDQAPVYRNHPDIGSTNVQPPDSPGFLPLWTERGEWGAKGRIGCFTCHLPHGREAGGGFTPVDAAKTEPAALKAVRPMIRPYVSPNLCSECHGIDGLRRFLNFHRPR